MMGNVAGKMYEKPKARWMQKDQLIASSRSDDDSRNSHYHRYGLHGGGGATSGSEASAVGMGERVS